MNLTKEKKTSWELKPHWVWSVVLYGFLGVGLAHLIYRTLNIYLF